MLVDIFYVIVGSFLQVFGLILHGLFDYVIPSQLAQGITQMFSYLRYFTGVLPLIKNTAASGLWKQIGIIDIFQWYLNLFFGYFIFKLFVLALSWAPFIGIHPQHKTEGGAK